MERRLPNNLDPAIAARRRLEKHTTEHESLPQVVKAGEVITLEYVASSRVLQIMIVHNKEEAEAPDGILLVDSTLPLAEALLGQPIDGRVIEISNESQKVSQVRLLNGSDHDAAK